MVYCGKPSEACGPCRAKKTKCDKARPFCGQCQRTNTKCEGYRDTSATLFRDQTQTVTNKVKALSSSSAAGARRKRTAASAPRRPRQEAGAASQNSPPLGHPLLVRIEDFAGVAFFDWFVHDGEMLANDCLGLVPEICLQSKPSSSLPDLVMALGLVSHPLMRGDKEMEVMARRKYTRALSSINTVLGDPVARLSDDTLMTIILLSEFEVLTGTTSRSIKSWQSHIDGAVNLLVLRGERQFQSHTGVTMFTHMRSRIIIACLQRGLPVPERLLMLSRAIQPHMKEAAALGARLTDICASMARVQADMYQDLNVDLEKTEERICALDMELQEWVKSMPAKYLPTRVYDDTCSFAFDGYYDVFASKLCTFFHNNYWGARIVLAQLRRANLREFEPDEDVTQRIEESDDVLRESSNAILAGIPYYLGDVGSANGPKRLPNLYSATGLIWLMHPIIVEQANPAWVRDLAYKQLVRVAEISGVQSARALAEAGRAGLDMSEWIEQDS